MAVPAENFSSGPDDPVPPRRGAGESASLGEVVEYVTEYAKQETLGPLRGAGRWLGYGAAASALLGLGILMLLLGLLRLLQTEWDRSATGSLSWLSYLIVVAVGSLVLGLTLSRINKSALNPSKKKETS
jgi:hypothetical protein